MSEDRPRLIVLIGATLYEWGRSRIGHRSQRYINRPEEVSAGYVEGF
jgi:hypothetical protein